ncbi:hypothetical protein, partial [Klebsiella pneumoniae]|uniref:hypothetical protein n=1 Tax=Klebsiella pneumoniae TaxID=573 RepID=UPI002731E613
QHELLIGTEYEDYRKKERVTAIAGSPYAIDIYNPVYGQPKPNGTLPGAGQVGFGVDRVEDDKEVEVDLDQIHFVALLLLGGHTSIIY